MSIESIAPHPLESRFWDWAAALIAARSVTDEGNLPAVAVVESIAGQLGFATRRLPAADTPERDANLLVGPIGDPTAHALLLVTHLDTVAAEPRSSWHTDPWTLVRDSSGRAFGLGAADVKLDALCKLMALARVDAAEIRLRSPVFFLGTYGEEAGLRGARAFVSAPPMPIRAALCGEPSGLRLYAAHKGYAMVSVRLRGTPIDPVQTEVRRHVFEGKSVHSSTPHLGVNAIALALASPDIQDGTISSIAGGRSPNSVPGRCVVDIGGGTHDFRAAWRAAAQAFAEWSAAVAALEPASDPRFSPSTAVCSWTRVQTTGDTLEAVFDARLLPAHDPETLHAESRRRNATVPSLSGATVDVLRAAAGLDLPSDHPLVAEAGAALASVGLAPDPLCKPTSTEAGAFFRAGIPALVFGPSRSEGNAHAANEFTTESEVLRAIDAYVALILRLAGESLPATLSSPTTGTS